MPSIPFYLSSFYPLRVQFLFTVTRFLCRPPGPEFRGNSRESGPRSPENRSQGLRPPWGVHASPRRSGAAGRGGSPSEGGTPGGDAHPGRAVAVRGRPRAQSGRDRGQRAGHSGKRRATGAKAGRFCRETAHSGRVSGGSRGAVAGGNRENQVAAARKQQLPAGFCRENSGAAGRERRGFGAVGGKKGQKKPPHGGVRAENGAEHGIFRTVCDGFTLFPILRPERASLRAYIGRNR